MCFADPNLYSKTEATIIELIERAERLENRRLARKLLGELEILLEDLHSWDPNDEICWDEFWSRIARIKSQLASNKL